jgi:hypothetical protein
LKLANQTLKVNQNNCGNVTVAIHSEYGIPGSPFVLLNVTGLPPDVIFDFEPNPINLVVGETTFSTLHVCASFNAQPGDYALQVTGMSSPVFHSTPLMLSVISVITNVTTATTSVTFSEGNVTTTVTVKCSGYFPQPDYPASVNTNQNFTMLVTANFECTQPILLGARFDLIDLSDGTVIYSGGGPGVPAGMIPNTHFTIGMALPVTAPPTPRVWAIQLRASLGNGFLVVTSDPITIRVEEAHPKSILLVVGLVGISAAGAVAVILYFRIGRKRTESSPMNIQLKMSTS